MTDFTDKGQFRANKYADTDNNLKLVDPNTPGTVAKDEATDIDTVTGSPAQFTGIKYEGRDDGSAQTIVFPTAVAIDDYDGLRDAIFAEIKKHEVKAIVKVSFSTPNVTVTHYGAGTLSKVLVDGADAGTFARTAI